MAGRAVVGGDLGVVEQRRAARVLGVAEAEQRRRAAELVLPDRQRRDPDAAADQQRRPAVTRRREADPQRAEDRQLVAGVSSHSRSVPGPTSSSMNCSSSVPAGARSTENARGRNGRCDAPPPHRLTVASM